MTIHGNRYNDPALGAAFSNIANLFAPPSAQDLVGYASAKAKKDEAERLSWLFANPTDPLADRKATMAGVYAPTQSYYAQDQNDATARYNINTDASTSLATNAADNAWALATNTADNQAGIAKQFMSPLSQGQVQPGLPGSIASQFGVPEFPRTEGQAKPLSDTEVMGQERLDLRERGLLTDDMLVNAIVGKEAPVKTVGPGGLPVFSTPGSAARTGAQAYEAPPTDPTSVQEFEYAQADGFAGTYDDWVTQKARAGATRVQVGADQRADAVANAQSTGTDVIANATHRTLAANKDRAVSGLAGYAASFNPGSQNAEIYRQIEVLKSNATIETLRAMRLASPTAGSSGLGALTNQEGAMLAATAGALNPASPNFARDIQDYTLTLLRTIHGYDAGTLIFEKEFGELSPDQKSRTPVAPVATDGTPPAARTAVDPSVTLQEARDAIANGAPADKVRARLIEMGLDPEDL